MNITNIELPDSLIIKKEIGNLSNISDEDFNEVSDEAEKVIELTNFIQENSNNEEIIDHP